jgi:hypothetical protein
LLILRCVLELRDSGTPIFPEYVTTSCSVKKAIAEIDETQGVGTARKKGGDASGGESGEDRDNDDLNRRSSAFSAETIKRMTK